ncbi:MAG: arsenate reductase family protein [Thermomicrobiales bacterium]
MIEAYIYTSCTSCRKTIEQLKASDAAFRSRDYFRDRFTREELADTLSRAGLTPREILSRRSKVYLARTDEIDALGDDALLDLMLQEPTLVRRPLVIKDGRAVIGHNQRALTDLIAS